MTEITCKLCDKIISLDPSDPETYIHKTESGNPLIGKLFTIRAGHLTESESIHINVVVIDEDGIYRAHKDYYEETLQDKSTPDLWDDLTREIPFELRPYLSLSNIEDRRILSSSPCPPNKNIVGWYEYLTKLKEENPNNQLLTLLAVKWGFIIGKGKELNRSSYESSSWSYPLFLRLQARFSPSPTLIEQVQKIDFKSAPLLLQLEHELAKAEVFLRLGQHDLLADLHDHCQKKWGNESLIEVKSGLMLIQAYNSFGLMILGKIKEALELIQPAFNFGQILENREIISVAGNFHAAILASSGELERPLEIYNIVLGVSEELGDERTKVVVSTNMSDIESKQGLYDQALKRQRTMLELPTVQEEFFLRSSLQSIIAETLFIAERYEQSREICQSVLTEKNLSTYYQGQLLSTLKKIAGKTADKQLLEFVRDNLPEDKEFLESPAGLIFKHDLLAIDAELRNDWLEMIDNLKIERDIMFENKLDEFASDIEIRLAQGYFKLYQENNLLAFLNHAYNHLDLAKTIALEKQSYLDLCRLVILKGLLAAESKASELAKLHFEEALKIAQEYKLTNLEVNIREHLDQLDKGTIEKSADSILRKIFRRLSFRKAEKAQTPLPKSIVYSIWIGKLDASWNIILQNDNDGTSEHTYFLKGCSELWNNIKKDTLQQLNYFTVSVGAVLIENSLNFQLIALCNHLDYITRVSIQKILPTLEEFSLKSIPEELSENVLKVINKDISKFSEVN
jgi:hypothetical protein